MAVDPLTLSAAASAVNAATPFVSRALQGLFGVRSAEDEERQRILEAMAPYMRVAQGGTTQGQAGLSYARGRAAQELQGQAARGTAQQQAGMQREAMRVGQDVNAQYASQLADLRAREQERAMMGVSRGQLALADVAREEAARKRQELAGFAEGVGGMVGRMLAPGEKPKPGTKPTLRMGGSEVMQGPASASPFDVVPTGRVSPRTAANRAARAAAAAATPVGVVRDVGERGTPVPEVDTLASTLRAATPAPETLAQSAFVAPEPPAQSIYGGVSLGSLGAATGPDMAPAPIAMRGFGSYLSPGRAPMPKLEPNNPATPTRRKATTAPKQRRKPIDLGDTFIEEVDSPDYITGRRPAALQRTR
jgi:hypothetical protein